MKVINRRYDPAVPISAIRLHPKNARAGDLGAICQSIEHNGWFGACLVQQSTGFILAGNHRHQAAAHSGQAMYGCVALIIASCVVIPRSRKTSDDSWPEPKPSSS